MELNDKRINYNISDVIDGFSFKGTLTTTDENVVRDINVNIVNGDGVQVGSAYLSERNGKINKNFNEIDSSLNDTIDAMFATFVANVKSALSE